ncbi:glycoside hydrolase family 95 protein [Paenibacillus phoenicis]|uniref:Glycoside hydrolase family 95 protein n=1 Tax=Paenibacillus phoenicis TaxID=554117 RepID=A0ABU5PQF5_9BACL|nr:glycoside hydrolase family 95 protein [Paenibacillus phoenicis]MEA3572153.1 glycoside hydrolase family 95 protein [Paenibacillus phoenicis]
MKVNAAELGATKLWYDKPAAGWSEGLPVGNGRIGAIVMAAPEREVWNLTESTYWSGQADETASAASGGKAALAAIRERLFAGDYAGGDRLAKQALQPPKRNFGTHLAMCDVVIEFAPSGEPSETETGAVNGACSPFRRELDLSTALLTTTSGQPGSTLVRELFASHVDDVLVSRIWSEAAGGVSFTLGLAGLTPEFEVSASGMAALEFRGKATETVHSDGACGVRCRGRIELDTRGGSLYVQNDRLVVRGADEACIYLTVATDYRCESRSWELAPRLQASLALSKGYDQLKADHLADYEPLFRRVSIELGPSEEAAKLLTDQRIRLLRQGYSDPQLFALFLQYGRYLTLAGSREDSPLPLHLQGIWNDGEACRMGWSCDYHLDVNTEMNYYPTEVVHLGESQQPLTRYLEDLARAGQKTARDVYGSPGWVAHVFSNVWGFTDPGWDTSWGLNVTGGLWLAMQMIEHYRFGLDRVFLEKQAYPVLREAALFFLDYMTVHPKYGWLVTGPSNSPENHFYPGRPEEGCWQLSMGSTMDQALVRELFTFCLEAAELLEEDVELRSRLSSAIPLLPPLQIGKKGQLQEWLEDYEEAQPEHRHLSHLFALYPAHQITPEETPELAAAARVTLENRMQQDELEDIEFTAALFGLFFARLYNGDRALKHISHLIGELCFDNLLSYSKAGIAGAETNIFVIDGNFGGTAAIAEMLLQSRPGGNIRLLPALPAAWPTGRVTGLRAKGNAEVDLAWEAGRLSSAVVRTYSPGTFTLSLGDRRVTFEAKAGGEYRFDGALTLQNG